MSDPHDPATHDPLAALAHVNEAPVNSAIIKARVEDFRVDEELGFPLSGDGEHLWLRLQKRGMGTVEVARLLAADNGLPLKDVGYSGMKDKVGETSQWFSLRTARTEQQVAAALGDRGLQLQQAERNARKLKIGSHRLNHFQLQLRQVDGDRDALEARLRRLREQGFPNYFGLQRFGRELSNLAQLAEQISADQGSDTPARLGRRRRSMLFSAGRSFLFNELLSVRVRQGSWNSYVPGDVLALSGSKSMFRLATPEPWDETLQGRLESFDIDITGPLYGIPAEVPDRYEPAGEAADIERTVLEAFPNQTEWLRKQQLQPGRRPLRAPAIALRWEWPQGNQLQLEFSLPRGAYATSLLRELVQLRSTAEATKLGSTGRDTN